MRNEPQPAYNGKLRKYAQLAVMSRLVDVWKFLPTQSKYDVQKLVKTTIRNPNQVVSSFKPTYEHTQRRRKFCENHLFRMSAASTTTSPSHTPCTRHMRIMIINPRHWKRTFRATQIKIKRTGIIPTTTVTTHQENPNAETNHRYTWGRREAF